MSERSSFPLILTLKLDQTTFDFFNQLRQQYFPPERNFLPAHITLFHALPGDQHTNIYRSLQEVCCQTPVMSLTFPKLRFLGQGVAVEVNSSDLTRLQQQLAKNWQDWLTRQDRQGYRPHITIQNKVTADAAQQLHNQLAETWQPLEGRGEGLLLWYYKGGPWELVSQLGDLRENSIPVILGM